MSKHLVWDDAEGHHDIDASDVFFSAYYPPEDDDDRPAHLCIASFGSPIMRAEGELATRLAAILDAQHEENARSTVDGIVFTNRGGGTGEDNAS